MHNKLNKVDISLDRSRQSKENLTRTEATSFRSLAGQLNWLAGGTRPDVSFDVVEASTKFNNACVSDLVRLNKVMHNARSVKSIIRFPKLGAIETWKMYVYTDAAQSNICDGVGSTSGYVLFLVSGLMCCTIDWSSAKLKRVVNSSLAAETLGMQLGIDSAIFNQQILSQMLDVKIPIVAITDSKSLVDSVYSTSQVENKRLRCDVGMLKEDLAKNNIENLIWVPGEQQLADCLTKRGASGTELLNVVQTGTFTMNLNRR